MKKIIALEEKMMNEITFWKQTCSANVLVDLIEFSEMTEFDEWKISSEQKFWKKFANDWLNWIKLKFYEFEIDGVENCNEKY